MFFENILGFRKLLMGLCMAGAGLYCDPPHLNLIVGIYGCFCIGNIIEHLADIWAKAPIPPQANPAHLNELLKKVLDSQETQLKALNYIVGFIQSTQAVTPTT